MCLGNAQRLIAKEGDMDLVLARPSFLGKWQGEMGGA